jgi:hypothetical protein
VVKLLAEHKAEVLEVLAASTMPATRSNFDPPSPWFERAIPHDNGEPGLEQPCVARR